MKMPIQTPPITLNPDVRHRSENFGGVVFHLETKDFYPVNHIGYDIVRMLSQETSLTHITDMLCDRYIAQVRQPFLPVIVEKIRDEFLKQLYTRDIIRGWQPLAQDTSIHLPAISTKPLRLKAPLVVSLAALFRCNLTCVHCYVGSTNETKPDNLSFQQHCQIIRQLKELEVFDIVLTGGEALLFKDIYDLIRFAKDLDLYVCLNTNGTLITTRCAEQLRSTRVDVVKISLDSATSDVHNAFRQQQRAWERSIAGIQNLLAQGVRVDIHTVISADSTHSTHDIDEVIALAKQLGVTRVHFGRVFSTGRGYDDLKVVNAQLLDLVAYVAQQKAQGETVIGRIPSTAIPDVRDIPLYDGCGSCARGVYAYLSYNGGVYPCTNLYKDEWRLGSLLEQNLTDIWQTSSILSDLRLKLAQAEQALAAERVHE
jgi:MoaA/NifB/PqqE/SkfB family radical SAM enzyme